MFQELGQMDLPLLTFALDLKTMIHVRDKKVDIGCIIIKEDILGLKYF